MQGLEGGVIINIHVVCGEIIYQQNRIVYYGKKTILTFSLFIFVMLSACTAENTSQSILQDIDNPEIEAVKELLIDNLKYAENKNIEGYLSTLPVDSHAETREVMEEFFNM